ncbi:MAG: hypothetical protein KHX09_08170 [Haemophilus parainfluenzae]|nr:hypothetical protein [Haemophilus parainfluenzae]
MVAPKTKHQVIAEEVGSKIESILSSIKPICDKELDELEHSASKLIFSSDTSFYGYEILGMIAALRKDKSKVNKYFKSALKKAPTETVLFAMYAKALVLVGEISTAIKKLDYYLDHITGDLLALKVAMNLYIFCGQTSKAEKIMQQLKKLKYKNFNKEFKMDLNTIVSIKQTGIPENILLDYVESIFKFAVDRNIDLRNQKIQTNLEESNSLWFFIYDNSLSEEKYLEYELELARYSLEFTKKHRDYPIKNLMFFLRREEMK